MDFHFDDRVIDEAVEKSARKLGLVPEHDKRAQKISLDDFRESIA